jgi:transposase
MMAEKRKTSTAAFKRAALDLVTQQGYSLSKAASKLAINVNMLRRWKPQVEEQATDAFPGNGHLLPEQDELRSLRQENQCLRMERDILKNGFVGWGRHL